MSRFSGILTGVTLVLASVVIIFGLHSFAEFWMRNTVNTTGRAVFYEVTPGLTPKLISKDLERLGVISSGRMFYWYGRITGKSARIKTGDYKFTDKMSPDQIMAVLMSGVSFGYPVTIPEGYNIDQIAGLLDKARPGLGTSFSQVVRDKKFIESLNVITPVPTTLEGFLFPDTYFITRQMSAEELVRNMVRNYRLVFNQEAVDRAKELGMTEYQILTLASVVEKETGAPEERPMVSSVFHNRLKKRMRLQSDPTVVYGLRDYDGNIRKKDLTAKHPYNTYVIPGLPIGPIANPGKLAILATLNPAASPYLYFVSRNDGTHEFTSTYEEHKNAVVKFQLDRKAREGRSWRELSERVRAGQSQ